LYETSRGDKAVRIILVSEMSMISPMGIIITQESFLTGDINKTVLESMRLP